jgi:hypothetical protein
MMKTITVIPESREADKPVRILLQREMITIIGRVETREGDFDNHKKL